MFIQYRSDCTVCDGTGRRKTPVEDGWGRQVYTCSCQPDPYVPGKAPEKKIVGDFKNDLNRALTVTTGDDVLDVLVILSERIHKAGSSIAVDSAAQILDALLIRLGQANQLPIGYDKTLVTRFGGIYKTLELKNGNP